MISCQLINFLHIVYLKNYLLILFYIFFFFVLCYYFYMYFFFFFFFSSRRLHTKLTCDWSSDVYSSDLAETLYNNNPVKMDHADVPTAVFSQPPIGTVGLTEEEARQQYGGDIDIYCARFKPMKNKIGRASCRERE